MQTLFTVNLIPFKSTINKQIFNGKLLNLSNIMFCIHDQLITPIHFQDECDVFYMKNRIYDVYNFEVLLIHAI